MRATHAMLLGGALGVYLFFGLNVIIGLPIGILMHSGNEDSIALGRRLTRLMSPVDEWLWERPLELSGSIGKSVGGDTWAAGVVVTLVLYGLPALAGAAVGLAVWGVRRLVGRRQ